MFLNCSTSDESTRRLPRNYLFEPPCETAWPMSSSLFGMEKVHLWTVHSDCLNHPDTLISAWIRRGVVMLSPSLKILSVNAEGLHLVFAFHVERRISLEGDIVSNISSSNLIAFSYQCCVMTCLGPSWYCTKSFTSVSLVL